MKERNLAHFNGKAAEDADKLWREKCTGEASKAAAADFLKTSFQVGSVRADTINYKDADRVFGSSDVPPAMVSCKQAVKNSVRPRILDTLPKPWDISVKADEKSVRTDLRRQLLMVRAGLMDQPRWYPRSKHKDMSPAEFSSSLTRKERDTIRHVGMVTGKGPVGSLTKRWFNLVDEKGASQHSVNPEDDFVGSWDISSSTCHPADVKARVRAFVEAEKRRVRMNGDVDAHVNRKTYRNPEEHFAEFQELVREKKRQYADIRGEFIRELRVEFPHASLMRLEAMARRLLDEKLLSDEKSRRYPIAHESFRPNLSLTTQDRRYREHYHPGAYDMIQVEGKRAWSCCLNYDSGSRGCEKFKWSKIGKNAACKNFGGVRLKELSWTPATGGGDAGDLAYYQEQLSQVKSLLDQDPENAEIKEVSWLGSVFGVEEIYEQLKDTVNILEESEKQKETVLAMGAEIEKERLAAAAALEAEKSKAAAEGSAAASSSTAQAAARRSHLVGRTCEVFYENKWFNAEITGVRIDELGTERCAVRFIGFDQRREYKVQDVALLKPPRPQEAPVGSVVQAIWAQDGLWYQCTILEHTVKGYKVIFEEDPGQTPEEVNIDQIR
ncbi:Survival of motor neuron--splicing factor 30 [Perkinsus olseni]|uniref:Survival of motor neuron--splicing factor 30 n=1 Tax=Perkinsus olseni TaxID=32597 RepID=A0A7J6TS15_PEROL|nr:Survival of motor neuron--splicing factor 30 [Perkinsus olseni]